MIGEQVEITLLQRTYKVHCQPEEREGLLQAVQFLAARLEEISAHTKASGERLAVMVALNLAHELLSLRSHTMDGAWRERLAILNQLLHQTLTTSPVVAK